MTLTNSDFKPRKCFCLIVCLIGVLLVEFNNSGSIAAQDHTHGNAQDHEKEHDHAHSQGESNDTPKIEAPKVFLDKSARIVEYQLKRLDNQRLLLVERKTDDPKYAPVYTAILKRAGMSQQFRDEALHALVAIRKTNAAHELLTALQTLKPDDRQEAEIARQLSRMLLRLPVAVLQSETEQIATATTSDNRLLRKVGFAAMIVADQTDTALQQTKDSETATLDLLEGIALVPDAKLRSKLRQPVVEQLDADKPMQLRNAALATLRSIPAEPEATFEMTARLIGEKDLQREVIRTLLSIPKTKRKPETSRTLVDFLVRHAESTPAADRTTDAFIDAMQLVDQLMVHLESDQTRAYRDRLSEITVRVVVIHTVEEEMRYDIPYFAVEAGRSVQIVLKNEDLMPHNLVIVNPDSLQEVALAGLAAGPNHGVDGKQYVPDHDDVLFATNMVQSRKQAKLTFTAPEVPGEYPYVCTFPQHWMRMYGVMVVVKDLDAWLKDPVEPADPVGSKRAFVKNWKVEDLEDALETGLQGRNPEIGKRIFAEAFLCAMSQNRQRRRHCWSCIG